LETAAKELKKRLGHHALLVTQGSQGMTLLEGDAAPVHIHAVGAQQAVDVTGAGDTVIATFALALASGASFTNAAHLANYAGGLVVMKRGTATVSASELEHAIRQD
jgi:bifunctional ADP-heptose synthase (sugar kinase/adenylyltransferase)